MRGAPARSAFPGALAALAVGGAAGVRAGVPLGRPALARARGRQQAGAQRQQRHDVAHRSPLPLGPAG